MKNILFIFFFILFVTFLNAQVQVGQNLTGEMFDDFASSVALSGDGSKLIVGSPGVNLFSGRVEVYVNENDNWVLYGNEIFGSFEQRGGMSTAISEDGNIIAVGFTGANNLTGFVRVFENINNVWTQIGEDIMGEASEDQFGTSISMSQDGSIIAISAPNNDSNGENAGQVKVFLNINDEWVQFGQDINGVAALDLFGRAIEISNDGLILVVGAQTNDSNGSNSGQVRVFQNIENFWTQIGQDLNGQAQDDRFGVAVSINGEGNLIAVGSSEFDGNGTNSGAVRVFQNIGNFWTQVGEDILGQSPQEFFGLTLSLSNAGNVLSVGAPFYEVTGPFRGIVRTYTRDNDSWTQVGDNLEAEIDFSTFGSSLDLASNGQFLVAGSPVYDNFSGVAKVYDLSGLVLSVQDVFNSNIEVYPNPTNGNLYVELKNNEKIKQIKLYDAIGRFLEGVYENSNLIDLSNYNEGVYFIEVTTTNDKKLVKRIIINS